MDYEPTGHLVFETNYGRPLLQDGEGESRIEDKLNKFIIRLVRRAGEDRIARRRREEEEKRRAEAERIRREQAVELKRRRDELEAKQKAEQAQVDLLLRESRDWRQSVVLRDYLRVIEQQVESSGGWTEQRAKLAEWLKWAHHQADRLDPLTPSPPSVLDERV